MAKPEKGTPNKLRVWVERCRFEAKDRVVIVVASGAEYDLTEWDSGDIQPGWEQVAFELMQSCANERGSTTQFYVRHMRDANVRATFEARCRSLDGDDASDFDGSAQSLVQGVYKQNAKLLDHSLAQTNAVLAPIMKSLEFAQGRLGTLEEERSKLAEENHELRTQLYTMTRELQQAAGANEERWAEKMEQIVGMAQAWMESQKHQGGRSNGRSRAD